MIDDNFSTHNHLLDAKARMLGSIQNDRGVDLSEVDYLNIEIKETQQKRKANSMPFFGIALVILVFSGSANTAPQQFFGVIAGLGFLTLACKIVLKQTKVLRSLTEKLVIHRSQSESDSSQ